MRRLINFTVVFSLVFFAAAIFAAAAHCQADAAAPADAGKPQDTGKVTLDLKGMDVV